MNNKRIYLYLVSMTAILLTCMTLFIPLQIYIKLTIRIILLLLSIAAWVIFRKSNYQSGILLSFSLIALNLAFLVVIPFTPQLYNLNINSSKGIALSKLSDSLIISTVIIIAFLVAKQSLKNICLASGYAMHYTRSIIASALIHAGADLMIIVPIFAIFGVTG